MGLGVSEFWSMTFSEYWQLYDALFGKVKKPITSQELRQLESEWGNGNFRRASVKANRRNYGA